MLLWLLLPLLAFAAETSPPPPSTPPLSRPVCRNDTDCEFYGDCCRWVARPRSPLLHCGDELTVPVPASRIYGRLPHFWMVAACADASHPDRELCEGVVPGSDPGRLTIDSPPAYGVSGRLYRNGHCLRCNGDQLAERLLTVHIACSQSNETTPEAVAARLERQGSLPANCLLRYVVDSRARACAQIDACPEGNDTLQADECARGPANFVLKWASCWARNAACLRCNSSSSHESCLPAPLKLPRLHFHPPDLVDLVFNFRLDFFDEPDLRRRNDSAGADDDVGRYWLHAQASLLAASDVGLIGVLTAYASLAPLRNRAGLLLMSHSAALLMVNTVSLLWLLGPQDIPGDASPWLVVLPTAFCFNAAFAWAALFGVDLLRTVRASFRPAGSRPARYARFALIGWGCPAVLAVAAACSMKFTQLPAESKRALQAGLLFAPWLFSLAFNACVLGQLWYRLIRLAHQTGRALEPAHGPSTSANALQSAPAGGSAHHTIASTTEGSISVQRLAGATARVSVLLGGCWLPFCAVVLSGISSKSPVYAAATAVRNLHGLLLFAAFVGNRRVRRQVSERLQSTSLLRDGGTAISRRLRRITQNQQQHQHHHDEHRHEKADELQCSEKHDHATSRRRQSDVKTTEIF